MRTIRRTAGSHVYKSQIKDKLKLLAFGDRLREAREAAHLSQSQAGDQVGRTHGAIGQWERGETAPPFVPVAEAAELYGVSLDWLWRGGEMGSGIEARVRKIHLVLRPALIQRLHKEIDSTEEAAKRLPPELLTEPVKDPPGTPTAPGRRKRR